ncbi:MAG: hypothetical protein H0W40_11515 [Methylibium sp.]|uniref:hypothetical protein n=1 Tax=Methylibium sp. TaxID=2067992 RepID=UPI0017FE0437|nr:hypothetical protein [Methylibium sp.]MBA3597985.1 hypothetical protein [Methylibium sp.]
MTKPKAKPVRRGYAPAQLDDQPLLRLLIAEATRRGDTLAAMSKALGVTYEHVAQWRRRESDVTRASRRVLEAAAEYLQVPTIFVLCLVGTIGLADLEYPSRVSMAALVRRQMDTLRMDPYFAGFFPESLLNAQPAIQHFVVMLYGELAGIRAANRNYEWMKSIHSAALGNIDAEAELLSIQARSKNP